VQTFAALVLSSCWACYRRGEILLALACQEFRSSPDFLAHRERQLYHDQIDTRIQIQISPTMADGIDRNADDKMEFSTSKEVTVAPTFEAMHLKENLLRGIYAYGYESPSAVQSRAIVQVCKGRDTIAQAQSGTGKTATFSVSILQVIDTAVRETQGRFEDAVSDGMHADMI
jgi:hypothetical protein